ncbi:uncharacterized protein TNCT_24991 [Trichonephila clavata]|uniref:Uncharacterized protein n=1 Tax=Trichonephila clavata TaxID=2740835 RepID=A0A8X6H9R2_TRICU|nr:uncharacterized protein TNCT_24991 [Trichonephila clavata]
MPFGPQSLSGLLLFAVTEWGSYFQGVSHQRGYGMFSNLFRMISPIAMKAGKYLGKHILSTGSKCMFDALLSPKAVQESLLTAGLFFRDSPGKIDATEILNAGDRYNICKDSKLMDMIGALHFDLGNQSKYLINSVNLRIKLERNKDALHRCQLRKISK